MLDDLWYADLRDIVERVQQLWRRIACGQALVHNWGACLVHCLLTISAVVDPRFGCLIQCLAAGHAMVDRRRVGGPLTASARHGMITHWIGVQLASPDRGHAVVAPRMTALLHIRVHGRMVLGLFAHWWDIWQAGC